MSFAHTLDDAAAASDHHTQYFEMIGHRSIYHDGWRAVCPWPGPSFAEAQQPFGAPISADTLSQLDATGWELYHVDEDFAETKNVAADNRDRLIALIGTWYAEAGKYNVLPVDGSALDAAARRATAARPAARPVRVLPRHPVDPVLRGAQGAEPAAQHHRRRRDPRRRRRGRAALPGRGRPAATRFFVKDGKLVYVHNYVARDYFKVRVGRRRARRPARAALRVRTDRRAEPARGQGCAGPVPALRRRRRSSARPTCPTRHR